MINLTNLKLLLYPLLFALGFFLATRCESEKRGGLTEEGNKTVKTTIKQSSDTTLVKVPPTVKTVYVDKPVFKYIYKDRIIPLIQPDSTPTLSVRRYIDTLQIVPNVKANYDLETTGVLNHISIGLIDTRPQKVINNTLQVTTEVKTEVPVTGLYIGGFSSPNLSSFGPQVEIVMPKLSIGAGYDIKSPEIQPLNRARLQIGYKLF